MNRALVAAVACLLAACGPSRDTLPSGAGLPVGADDAFAAFIQATRFCAGIRTLTAEMAVSGTAGSTRVRVRVTAGLLLPDSARLEAVAPFGAPLFVLAAGAGDATLFLPRDRRALRHGAPRAVFEAVTGLPLDAADLAALLTGCADPAEWSDLRRYGATWQVMTSHTDELFLHRENETAPWRLVARVRRLAGGRRWREEFGDYRDGTPRAIRITSLDDAKLAAPFDLRLGLSQVDLNVSLGADVFAVAIPTSALPITLDELRHSGPLGGGEADGR